MRVTESRHCSRPGCGRPAVATLTYAYADQTAVVGPLAEEDNPHSWDLCSTHRDRISAPVGWELVRVDRIELDEDDDLMALAQAVKEVLAAAITQGGTTLRDFVSGQGEPGYFAQQLNVYGRHGQPCLRCGSELKRITLGQRASVFCPGCQR